MRKFRLIDKEKQGSGDDYCRL